LRFCGFLLFSYAKGRLFTVNYVVAVPSHILYVSLYIMRENLDALHLIFKYIFLNIYERHWKYASDGRGNYSEVTFMFIPCILNKR
jgi:hypothetical protein